MTDFSLVTTIQYQEESKKWLSAIKRRENILVTFFPKTDRLRRIQQFLENQNELKLVLEDTSKFMFQLFEFGLQNIEDKQDLHNHIAGKLNYTQLPPKPMMFDQWMAYFKKNHINLILVIPQIEKLWDKEGQTAQTVLSYFVDEYYPLITTFGLSEVDITHPSIMPYLPDSMRLYQNMYHYPLYKPEDAVIFIRYLQNKWNMHLKEGTEEKIIKDCGGHLWLLKEAVRQNEVKDYPTYPGEGLKFRANIIYNSLLESEQDILEKIVRGKTDFTKEEEHSGIFLQKIGLLNTQQKCLIGLFKDYILDRNEAKSELTIKNNHLILNHVPIEKFFSRKEYRIIKALLENEGKIVSRDEIAKHIWPLNTQENYSDWAIDQLIVRVRKRLKHLYLSPKLLQSVRGKGYLLKLQ